MEGGIFQLQLSDDRERVRDASPIEEIIQEYLPLLADGKNLKALCPFHAEKTPSFKVDPDRGTYRCFGCDERGDVFSFVMKLENVGFRECLELLAERAGITLSGPAARGGAGDRSDRQKEYDLLLRASRWFQKELKSDRGIEGRRYLSSRGFTEETLQHFIAGYAPDGWSNLSQDMARSGVEESVSRAVGLVKQGSSGSVYDTFRSRVMFPIRTLQGRVVGFGGRVLPKPEPAADDRKEAKYINSQESSVFQKGRLLYGLFEGRDTIRRQRSLLVMEGYTDVMMAHQAGFTDAVATLGTALTEANAEQVSRHADQVRLVFDGDEAGRRAARKAVSLFVDREVEVRVVLLPMGDDPCQILAQPDGRGRFVEHLEKARGILEFLLDELIAECGVETGDQKHRVARGFFAELARVSSEIRRQQGLELLGEKIGVPLSRVAAEFERGGRDSARKAAPQPRRRALPGDEEALILAAIANPERSEVLFELYPPAELQDEDLRRLAHLMSSRTGAALSALDIEDPRLKSRFLALTEVIENRTEEGDSAVRLVQELLCFRIELVMKETRRQLTSGVADRELSHRLLEKMQQLQLWFRRLGADGGRDWDELLAVYGDARGHFRAQ